MTNVEHFRKIRGLTQTQLADVIGTSQPHISRIERGDDGPPLKMFKQIADALGVTLSDLFAENRGPAEMMLLETFRSLPPERQRGWLDMARIALADVQRQESETD